MAHTTLRLALAVASMTLASVAAAQPLPPLGGSLPQARKLFYDAQRFYAQRDYKRACAALFTSYTLNGDLRTQINLADCTQQSGDLLGAEPAYEEAEQRARIEDSPLLGAIQQLREKLRKDTPTLSVQVSLSARLAHCDDVRVEVDGAPLAKESWDVPKKMNPGKHVVVTFDESKAEIWKAVVALERGTAKVALVPGYSGFTVEGGQRFQALTAGIAEANEDVSHHEFVRGCEKIARLEPVLDSLPSVYKCSKLVDAFKTAKAGCAGVNLRFMELLSKSVDMTREAMSRTPPDREAFRRACDMLGQAVELDPTQVESMANKGYCEQNLGEFRVAYAFYKRAQRAATDAGKGDVAKDAGEHLSDLRRKLTFVVIAPPAGTKVRLQRIDGPETHAGPEPALASDGVTPTPVDPGTYRVVCTEPTREILGEPFVAHGGGETQEVSPCGLAHTPDEPNDTADAVPRVPPAERGCACRTGGTSGDGAMAALSGLLACVGLGWRSRSRQRGPATWAGGTRGR